MPGSNVEDQKLPAPETAPCDGSCSVIIDGKLYDLTQWQHVHPGGPEILQPLNGKDATEPFFSLHSEDALKRLSNMGHRQPAADHKVDSISANFAAFRSRMREQGFYRRNPLMEIIWNAFPLIGCIIGTMIANSHPYLATLLIGLAMQQAGWLGHDYVHGRGTYCWYLARLYGLINGFSARWWSHKHNTHHVYPNRWEYDLDIHNEPFLYLFLPNSTEDKPWRKYQHYYYLIVYSFLYASWRYQSLQEAIKHCDWVDLVPMAVNYFWLLFVLPLGVSIGSILVGGWCVAVVVTANHQVQELFYNDKDSYHYITDQFHGTCDVDCGRNLFLSWFFGGMQYQLEHHLCPTVPKYYYPSLRPLIKKFAADNNIPYHIMGVKDIMVANYNVVKTNAGKPLEIPISTASPLTKVNDLTPNSSLDSLDAVVSSPGPDTPDRTNHNPTFPDVRSRQPVHCSGE